MLVKNWMSSSVISINANDSIKEAMALLRKYEIRMLPVIDNDKLVGVVTDRDVKKATGLNCVETEHLDPGFTIKKVSSIMTGEPITVLPEYAVEDV
ncbi:MAG: CBS domain-containing protein, partial [Deltaproteobacteria bacterium]|nr:CBS domain-containing protein [Deltaproteobacteria bacterium]